MMQKGDKVFLSATKRTGVVVEVGPVESKVRLDVMGTAHWFYNDLIVVSETVTLPREISLEEIQVGDKIRSTAAVKDGDTVIVSTGTVAKIGHGVITGVDGHTLYFDNESTYESVTIELLERPKVNPFAEAGIHSVAVVPSSSDFIWVKEAENTWRAYQTNGKWANRRRTNSDDDLFKDRNMKLTFKA